MLPAGCVAGKRDFEDDARGRGIVLLRSLHLHRFIHSTSPPPHSLLPVVTPQPYSAIPPPDTPSLYTIAAARPTTSPPQPDPCRCNCDATTSSYLHTHHHTTPTPFTPPHHPVATRPQLHLHPNCSPISSHLHRRDFQPRMCHVLQPRRDTPIAATPSLLTLHSLSPTPPFYSSPPDSLTPDHLSIFIVPLPSNTYTLQSLTTRPPP